MKHKILFLLGLLVMLTVTGCRKESDITEFGDLTFHKSDIFGIVLDENGKAVKDAIITFGSQIKATDANGIYSFNSVDVNSRHSVIHIDKAGYFRGIKVFSTGKPAKLQLRTILLEKNFDKEFNGGNGGTVNKDEVTLEFPANSIVVESTKALYTGQVSVAIAYLDPESQHIWQQMPGNMSAINGDNRLTVLSTFGMVAVELRGAGGEKLNIGAGSKVKMSAVIPPSLRSTAPSTIPLWYFDEVSGFWKEEGDATISGNKYIGEVTHFSYWNYDSQNPSINLSGRVLDQNGVPVSGLDIRVFASNEPSGGHGYSNPDGTFSGPVAENLPLTIEIMSVGQGGCASQLLYTSGIGPFAGDSDLGDITVNIPTSNTYNITADIINCAGTPVQNGYMVINLGQFSNQYLQIQNGSVATTIISCQNNLTFSYYAVDVDAQVESPVVSGTLTANTDLGTISACGIIGDNINIVVPSLGVNKTIPGSNISSLFIDTYGFIFASDSVNTSIQLRWNDNSVGNFNVGTFNVLSQGSGMNLTTVGNPGQFEYTAETGTVTISSGGGWGSTIEGTFTINMLEVSTSTIVPITGSFKKKFGL